MVFVPFESSFGMFGGVFIALFVLVFIAIIGIIIFTAVKGTQQWSRNNASPVLTVWARVVAKRTQVNHHHHTHMHNDMPMGHITTSTTYYVTFEVASRDRIEFLVSNYEYGMLAEEDWGNLTFQGTRFKGFVRYST